MPPAVIMEPSPAIASVPGPIMMSTPGWTSGFPALPMPLMRPSLYADISLDYAPVVHDECIGNDHVRDLGAALLALAHAVADDLASTEFHLISVCGAVFFNLQPQFRICQRTLSPVVGPNISAYAFRVIRAIISPPVRP